MLEGLETSIQITDKIFFSRGSPLSYEGNYQTFSFLYIGNGTFGNQVAVLYNFTLLVANLVILYNVQMLSTTILYLKKLGFHIDEELLAHTSGSTG